MLIYSHVNYTLKGYTWLTHEAIVFLKDEIREVSEEVGTHLLGTHPLEFCQVPKEQTVHDHLASCPYSPKEYRSQLGQQVDYANRRLPKPKRHRQMRTR